VAKITKSDEMKKLKIDTETKLDAAGNAITWITDVVKAAIQTALDEANGTATAFTVRYANDVYHLRNRAESYLQEHRIPESDRAGATVTFRPKGPAATAYKKYGDLDDGDALAYLRRLVPHRRQALRSVPAERGVLPGHDQ
jgi:hypothetical protein